MVLLTLCILCASFIKHTSCLQVPVDLPDGDSTLIIFFAIGATIGVISLIGACALCFRRKKTFEKLENESGLPENVVKKNEYPIFRALGTEANESSAIVPCERNNLSRDNLLNSADHLPNVSDEDACLERSNAVDSSDIVLIEKSLSLREKSQRDTITYETEKKLHQAPSSKTPLLYAKNVHSYQEPVNEQFQQKPQGSTLMSQEKTFNHFYDSEDQERDEDLLLKKSDSITLMNSSVEGSIQAKEISKDDASEIESSVNDNSEKYQILEEETDAEDIKLPDDRSTSLQRQNSKGSNCSSNDKSVEEALRALDIAIGFEDDDCEDFEFENNRDESVAQSYSVIKEEATFLVDSIVNDCEKILEKKKEQEEIKTETCFEDFLSLNNRNFSTPCTKLKTDILQHEVRVETAKALFANDFNDETFQLSAVNDTFDIQPLSEKTFDKASPEIPTIKIVKEKEETGSEDLTTATPVNTPIELSYTNETWDKMTGAINKQSNVKQNTCAEENDGGESSKITFNNDGWYLHQAKNDTFDIYCEEEEEGNIEDMASTFDQLRRQLTEMLPHAQGMSAHNDFLDDELNKDSNSPSENYGIKYGELDEATNAGAFQILNSASEPVAEMNINYNNNFKRPLSPIMEESECEETCRTYVFNNETKLLDSTSTGILESASAEAVMGQMPKTLMASNDTLFNFEDTLSDPTDNLLMSPRMHTGGSSTSSTLSRNESQDKISMERTPTNEDLPKILEDTGKQGGQDFNASDILKNNIRQHPLDLDLNRPVEATSKYELAKVALEDGTWPLELPEAQQIINDLSSPLSFEQDITYTIDDQKTCVSFVLKNDEERISEISEPLFASESLDMHPDDDNDDDRTNSLQIDDAVSLDADDNFNFELNDENGNQDVDIKDINIQFKESAISTIDNDSINFPCESAKDFEIDSLEPQERILKDELEADSIAHNSQTSKSVYSNDSIEEEANVGETVQSNDDSESDCVENCGKNSSDDSEGSESKKETSPDIRNLTFCNQSVMSTSFTKEWSDDDSSHSSEEFMYVKGDVERNDVAEENITEEENADESKNENENVNDENLEAMEIIEMKTWSAEVAQNNVSPVFHKDDSDDDNSGEENEFVPSIWDHSLQPSKSSLKCKSPEKESSPDSTKTRRVAFKIQRYHSVYEYPKEVVQLSPAYSEPHLWSNYMDDFSDKIDFFSYTNPLPNISDSYEGFSVSSSSRPFHSAHQAQLHNTWPNESTDFSWSMYSDSNQSEEIKLDKSPFKIDWPERNEDSGVEAESSDSPSVGESNYSKCSLRLPLELINSNSSSSEVSDFISDVTKDLELDVDILLNDDSQKPKIDASDIEDENEKIILPTPSGSIDSLSDSSSSSPSFTTFGKTTPNEIISTKSPSIIYIDETNLKLNCEKRCEIKDKMTVGSDSSSDDSGFENVQIINIK